MVFLPFSPDATVYRICKRHGLNRLPNRIGRRTVHTHSYEKQIPGHHVQVDVRFLTLKQKKRHRYGATNTLRLTMPHAVVH